MLGRSIKSSGNSILKVKPIKTIFKPFSSTSNQSFFFNKPPPNKSKLLEDLSLACKSDRLDLVSSLYPSLIKSLNDSTTSFSFTSNSKSSPSSSSSSLQSTHEALQELMSFVSKTNRFNLLLKIFDDLPKFGFRPDGLDHTLLLRGMANTGRSSKGIKWLESMELTWGTRPKSSHWNIILDGFRKEKNEEGMRLVIKRMDELSFGVTTTCFNTLITGLFELGNLEGVREIRTEMDRRGLIPDTVTYTALLTGFTSAGEMASAKQPAEALKKLVASGSNSKNSVDITILNALIKQECSEKGIEGGCKLAESYRSSGFKLDKYTLNTLVKAASKDVSTMEEGVEILEKLEEIVGKSSDRRSWTMLVKGILAHPNGTIKEAMKLYQEARDRSIPVDSAMVQPLLTSLLEPSPTPATFIIAKDLYEDLSTSSRSYSTGPDSGIYITLLRACANINCPDLDFSRTLIGDMRERSIRLDGKVVTWHIIALMRAADSFESAFECYDSIRSLDAAVLNLQSYNTILSAFTSLSFPPRIPNGIPPSAPPPLILEFLSDMRRTQNPPDVITYTLLLSYYSRSTSSSASSIAHIHSLIKLDINLDPDTILFNSLMMAYSRVGAYSAAYRIWDTMRLNHRYTSGGVDTSSISIILDTCTWEIERNKKTLKVIVEGNEERGEKIWLELRKEGFELNLKNWESYLEYLCRAGRIDDAINVVFVEMGNGEGRIGPLAEKTTLETLMKFSRRFEGKFVQVKERIRIERPELWEEVKDVAKWKEDKPDELVKEVVPEILEEERTSIARF